MSTHAEHDLREECSDSNYSSNISCAFICSRTKSNPSLQKYKGVVPQQNGNWGAQIYANHQRVWLGTFKSELEAAIAYDRASIKLRSTDSPRNFPWTNLTLQETKFQSHYSTEAILNMIKDGSYKAKLSDFLSQKREKELNLNVCEGHERSTGFSCTLLFQKELTPSDVGKLNKLVIPKKYAIQYFPHIPDSTEGVANAEVHLPFFDSQKKLWKFRYCYWKSSQSFVFTRGWNQFVKEKKLRANDTIVFYYYESPKGREKGFYAIDVSLAKSNISMGANLQLGVGTNANYSFKMEVKEDCEDQKLYVESCQTSHVERNGFKLFGVQIV